MILAIDIGNTNIVIGCVDQEKTYFIERISTDRSKTELEYAIMIKNVLDIYKIAARIWKVGLSVPWCRRSRRSCESQQRKSFRRV